MFRQTFTRENECPMSLRTVDYGLTGDDINGAVCSACGKTIRVKLNGTFRRHRKNRQQQEASRDA